MSGAEPDLIEALREVVRRGLGGDAGAFDIGEIADLQHRIDVESESQLRRQPPGARMRRIDKTQLLKILHHIADRRRRQRHRQQARKLP